MVRVEYVRVSHRTSVLAKASVVPDSHAIDVVAKRCVDQITCKQSRDNRFSITQDARAFHISVSKGFTAVCATDKDIPRYLAFRLLEEIQQEVGETYGVGCMGDFKQNFARYLQGQIEKVNDQVHNMILDASAEEELNQVVGTSALKDLPQTTKKKPKKGDAPAMQEALSPEEEVATFMAKFQQRSNGVEEVLQTDEAVKMANSVEPQGVFSYLYNGVVDSIVGKQDEEEDNRRLYHLQSEEISTSSEDYSIVTAQYTIAAPFKEWTHMHTYISFWEQQATLIQNAKSFEVVDEHVHAKQIDLEYITKFSTKEHKIIARLLQLSWLESDFFTCTNTVKGMFTDDEYMGFFETEIKNVSCTLRGRIRATPVKHEEGDPSILVGVAQTVLGDDDKTETHVELELEVRCNLGPISRIVERHFVERIKELWPKSPPFELEYIQSQIRPSVVSSPIARLPSEKLKLEISPTCRRITAPEISWAEALPSYRERPKRTGDYKRPPTTCQNRNLVSKPSLGSSSVQEFFGIDERERPILKEYPAYVSMVAARAGQLQRSPVGEDEESSWVSGTVYIFKDLIGMIDDDKDSSRLVMLKDVVRVYTERSGLLMAVVRVEKADGSLYRFSRVFLQPLKDDIRAAWVALRWRNLRETNAMQELNSMSGYLMGQQKTSFLDRMRGRGRAKVASHKKEEVGRKKQAKHGKQRMRKFRIFGRVQRSKITAWGTEVEEEEEDQKPAPLLLAVTGCFVNSMHMVVRAVFGFLARTITVCLLNLTVRRLRRLFTVFLVTLAYYYRTSLEGFMADASSLQQSLILQRAPPSTGFTELEPSEGTTNVSSSAANETTEEEPAHLEALQDDVTSRWLPLGWISAEASESVASQVAAQAPATDASSVDIEPPSAEDPPAERASPHGDLNSSEGEDVDSAGPGSLPAPATGAPAASQEAWGELLIALVKWLATFSVGGFAVFFTLRHHWTPGIKRESGGEGQPKVSRSGQHTEDSISLTSRSSAKILPEDGELSMKQVLAKCHQTNGQLNASKSGQQAESFISLTPRRSAKLLPKDGERSVKQVLADRQAGLSALEKHMAAVRPRIISAAAASSISGSNDSSNRGPTDNCIGELASTPTIVPNPEPEALKNVAPPGSPGSPATPATLRSPPLNGSTKVPALNLDAVLGSQARQTWRAPSPSVEQQGALSNLGNQPRKLWSSPDPAPGQQDTLLGQSRGDITTESSNKSQGSAVGGKDDCMWSPRKSLGIRLLKLGAKYVQAYAGGQLDTNGAVAVIEVKPDSAGQEAGLLKGDLIVEVDGTVVDSVQGFSSCCFRKRESFVELKVMRPNNRIRQVRVQLR